MTRFLVISVMISSALSRLGAEPSALSQTRFSAFALCESNFWGGFLTTWRLESRSRQKSCRATQWTKIFANLIWEISSFSIQSSCEFLRKDELPWEKNVFIIMLPFPKVWALLLTYRVRTYYYWLFSISQNLCQKILQI